MDYVIIAFAALLTSLLTFFSGFGLGTLLMPVFAIFFPVEYAIALTAIVHFLNSLFKLTLVGKHINWQVALRFGIPAILGAVVGSLLLDQIDEMAPLYTYKLGGHIFQITTIKLIISALILIFTIMESAPRLSKINISALPLWTGGILSGFFGGLSGHQGALRSAFLVKYYLPKEVFIATGVAIACMVDISRLVIYTSHFTKGLAGDTVGVLITAILAAFAGAMIGNKLLKKSSMESIKEIVAVLLVLMAIALGAGLI